MTSDRFDSGDAQPRSAVTTSPDNQNAPLRRLERLASIRMERLNDASSHFHPEPFATPPSKAGSKAKRFRDETTPPLVFNTKGGFHFSEIDSMVS
jgi:hypothetical protein